MMKHVFSILMVLLFIHPIYAQNRVIQGKVIDEFEFEPRIGALIYVNDSIEIGVTGIDGCFRIETSIQVDKLSIYYLGMERADLRLSDDCNYIELIMVWFPTYDFMSLRKINKIRRKIYKKLPKLHQEAYEKGIFQSPEICYIQEFIEFKE